MLSQPRNKLNQQLCRQTGYISHTHLSYHLVQVQSYSHAPWSYIHTRPTLNFRCCFLRMLHTVLSSGRWGIHWDFILTNVFSGNTRSMVPHMGWFEGDWSLENMIQPYKKTLAFCLTLRTQKWMEFNPPYSQAASWKTEAKSHLAWGS